MTQKTSQPGIDSIQAIVDDAPLVLFMKGTPEYPMCGYSHRAIRALEEAGAMGEAGSRLKVVNVLEMPEIRANLPRFSNLPTFPQLFMHGELIGGCDIVLELLESGELPRIVAEAGAQ